MGCGGSKRDFSAIEKSTGMSPKEVNASFKAFKKEAGSENIQLDKFTKLVANMNTNTGGNVSEYAKHLFRAFDTDVDGYVSFEEVIVGFHHLSGGGDENQKMQIVFRIYDTDNNRVLCPANVKDITKSQYLLQGKPLDDDEINNKVKSCFSQCDLNCDGKISEDEFFKAGKSVAEMFELEGDD